jgi:hypothetical protein
MCLVYVVVVEVTVSCTCCQRISLAIVASLCAGGYSSKLMSFIVGGWDAGRKICLPLSVHVYPFLPSCLQAERPSQESS